ncbi:hypothetical protein [uncultured Tateyamaria sp.]|uniref:hypothetical protein n=1 Tax=uncultured Tateyamaria sp. TaxID=455651 RepID=UPI002626CF37|nr:hypothetical protein [uncultured Tateyamaria sp.]
MSGVLQRLVARAAGTETPGLQARLPARFEAGGMMEDGFSERVDEVTVEPRNAHEESSGAPATDAPATESVTGEVRADPRETHISPELTPRTAQKRRAETVPEDRQNDGPPVAELRGDADDRPSAPPAPLVTAVERLTERVVTQERLPADAAPSSAPFEGDAPPEPLLSTEPAERQVEALPVAPIPTKRAERGAPAGDPVGMQPPEISIHIGRIEVWGETEKAVPRKRAPRELKLSSLSDFLGGGAS